MADPKLIKQLRSRIGQALYVARESRPDMACSVSMLAQTLPNPSIQDIKDANKFIRQWKQKSNHFLEIVGFPDEEIVFLASTDSAWANCRSGHSQAGYFIGATTREMASGSLCKVSPLVWESAKLKRVCPSTLAAEAMAMTKCMAETTFIKVM